MKRWIAKLILLSMFITFGPAGALAAQGGNARQPPPNPFAPGQGLAHKLPKHAVVGSTPERRAAWEKLTPEQRQDYLKRFQAHLTKALSDAAVQQRGPNRPKPKDRWVRSDVLGKKLRSAVAGAATRGGLVSLTNRAGAVSTSELIRPIEDPGDPGSYPPVVNVSASPTAGAAPLTVQLYSYAYDPDGWVTDYYWDFGDGGWAYDSAPIHTYTSPGVYTAWLTVTDNTGLSSWAAVNISVTGGGNLPPAVTASGSPLSGFAPLSVAFNAAASDPDGYIASYYWDFGDGQSSNQASPVHVYQAGNFTASVTVSDNAGATASASLGVQVATVSNSGTDADADGLPDSFENSLADAFTPVYRMSGGEQAGTGFARFGDFSPQTVTQNLPLLPPVTHVRVTPVGFATDVYGRQLGFLQVDYLTLLNRDDGLSIGGDCRVYASILGGLIGLGITGLLDGLDGHPLEQERSATLVAALTTASYQYSTDPSAYQAYDYYTAAHEGTFFDHSAYFGPSQPVPAGNHLNLALSKAKHGTYPFNPDYYPLFPDWVIYTTYSTLDFLYFDYIIDYYDYLIYSYIADTVFFSCVVEHFQDQGGSFPGLQLNVGELSHPINGSGFILDPKVSSKLTPLLWWVQ
ncbi:MAG TPA: PKD domain-containing protein [Thermoanaerobaculia bacterium]|nr:PKD domain-containing protein [Thermoanaerobaculia bacterium]